MTPAGGDWVLLAEVGNGRRPAVLLAVEGEDGLCWTGTHVDQAATWLLRADAAAARRAEVARRGRMLIRVVRREDAVVLLRWARFGVLADVRSAR